MAVFSVHGGLHEHRSLRQSKHALHVRQRLSKQKDTAPLIHREMVCCSLVQIALFPCLILKHVTLQRMRGFGMWLGSQLNEPANIPLPWLSLSHADSDHTTGFVRFCLILKFAQPVNIGQHRISCKRLAGKCPFLLTDLVPAMVCAGSCQTQAL